MAIVRSSIRGCCGNENTHEFYGIVGGELTNGICNQSLNLGHVKFRACDQRVGSVLLNCGDKYEFDESTLIAITSNNKFLITSDFKEYFNKSNIVLDYTTDQNGSIVDYDITFSYKNDDTITTLTWATFYQTPYTQQYNGWNIQENWEFYSQHGFTTNIIPIPDFNDIFSEQILIGEPKHIIKKYEFGYSSITLEFDIDDTSITVTDVSIISDMLPKCTNVFNISPNNFVVYNTHITKYNIIESVFLINSLTPIKHKVTNIWDSKVRLEYLIANVCGDESPNNVCGCC